MYCWSNLNSAWHAWVQDGIAVLDDLLQHALEGLQVKAQLDTGSLSRKAPKQTAMKVQLP